MTIELLKCPIKIPCYWVLPKIDPLQSLQYNMKGAAEWGLNCLLSELWLSIDEENRFVLGFGDTTIARIPILELGEIDGAPLKEFLL